MVAIALSPGPARGPTRCGDEAGILRPLSTWSCIFLATRPFGSFTPRQTLVGRPDAGLASAIPPAGIPYLPQRTRLQSSAFKRRAAAAGRRRRAALADRDKRAVGAAHSASGRRTPVVAGFLPDTIGEPSLGVARNAPAPRAGEATNVDLLDAISHLGGDDGRQTTASRSTVREACCRRAHRRLSPAAPGRRSAAHCSLAVGGDGGADGGAAGRGVAGGDAHRPLGVSGRPRAVRHNRPGLLARF